MYKKWRVQNIKKLEIPLGVSNNKLGRGNPNSSQPK